jgi:TPR repeat protein
MSQWLWRRTRQSPSAKRYFKLAAAQWFGVALHNVTLYFEKGWIVAADRAEAVRWYKRAGAAGSSFAEDRLKALSAWGARDTAALHYFPCFV